MAVHGDLVGIQYIRAAAALMVVFDHASGSIAEPKYFGQHPFSGFFEAGAVGVDLFFCLSGFIIVYITLSPDLSPELKPAQFLWRRFARIIPFMWVMIAVYACLRVFGRGYFPFWNYVRAFMLFPIGEMDPKQVWTLKHELLFYVIFALSFLRGQKWIFHLWALSPFAALLLLPAFVPVSGFFLQLSAFFFNGINLLFGLGVIVGIFYVRHKNRWPTLRAANQALIAGLIAVFAAASILSFGRWGITSVHDMGGLLRAVIIGALSCSCLAIACCVRPSKRFLGKLGQTLGDSSYAIYLVHPIFISALVGLAATHFRHMPLPMIMGTVILVSVIGGVLVSRYIEDPIVAVSKRIIFREKSG